MKLFKLEPNDTLTFVGIHVRRSDYKEHLAEWYGKEYVQKDYFPRAIEYYRKQFQVWKAFNTIYYNIML